MSDISVQEQGEIVREFVSGLVEAFGLDAETTMHLVDDETAEVEVEGEELGILIGQKGQTLQAIQSLSRVVVQRQTEGRPDGRVNVDVSGFRAQRREALARFATQVAEQVLDTGAEKSLEPMSAADRKVVHDTVNEIEGVSTTSEGEDPRRRVVIVPAQD